VTNGNSTPTRRRNQAKYSWSEAVCAKRAFYPRAATRSRRRCPD
jgi:hypothetical protein